MPAAMTYILPGKDGRDLSFVSLDKERANRRDKIEKARNYYARKQRKFLDKKSGEPDDNVIINNTRISVDRTLSMLFPAMPQFELDANTPEQTPDEKWLQDVWRLNGGLTKLNAVGQNGALTGHVYVRIKPPAPNTTHPRVVNLDPASMTTYWKADDVETVLWHEQMFSVGETDYMIDYLRDAETGYWSILYYEKSARNNDWKLVSQESWNSIWPPVVSWSHIPQANSYYGLSETDNLDLDDSINLATSQMMRINRYHGSPKTVAIGIQPHEIEETAIDGLWATENESANIYNLEMDASAGQFADDLVVKLTDAKMAENRVVVLRGDIKDFQRVTNPGIRTVFMDMLAKNILLREQYGRAIQAISMSLAYVVGRRITALPTIVWADPLPNDETETVNNAQKKLVMGVASKTQVAAELGYNYKEVAKLLTTEALTNEPEM